MKKIDNYVKPLYQRMSLCFECTQCGRCCIGGSDHFVFLCAGEAETIRDYLQLSTSWFRRRYLGRDEGDLVVQSRPNGACIFLKNDQCRIYPVRPLQCRTYPFWPEILKNRKNWNQEAVRCEGVNRGTQVPVNVIEAALRSFERC